MIGDNTEQNINLNYLSVLRSAFFMAIFTQCLIEIQWHHRIIFGRQDLYFPLPIVSFFGTSPITSATGFVFLEGIMLFGLFVAAVGYRAQISIPIATVAYIIFFGIFLGYTRVPGSSWVFHNQCLPVWIMISLSLFANKLAPPSIKAIKFFREKNRSFTASTPTVLVVIRVLVVSALFFAGLNKVFHSGLSWATSENLSAWLMYKYLRSPSEITLALASNTSLMSIGAKAVLVFELLAPAVLFLSRFRFIFIGLAFAFLISVKIALDINYLFHFAPCLLFFFEAKDIRLLLRWTKLNAL